MIAPCTMPRKYPIVSSLLAGHALVADPDAYLTIRRGFLYSADIKIRVGTRSGARRLEADHGRRRRGPSAAGHEDGGTRCQVDHGAKQDRRDAAEAVQK